jgi:fluoride exporter
MGGYLAVFVGAGFGGMLRHGVNRASLAYFGPGFPYGTLFVNIAGGLLMGAMAEIFLVKGGGSQEFRLFLTTGLLGGFTTFSAFSLEAALMWQRGDYLALSAYAIASVLFSIAALFLGMGIVRALT